MTQYVAEIDDANVVLRAIVCGSVEWAIENLGGVWVASDSKIATGHIYDEELDAFIPPKPFESWVLNEDTRLWEAPLPYPEDGESYTWNEETEEWEEVENV
jgi:hypothetical protein